MKCTNQIYLAQTIEKNIFIMKLGWERGKLLNKEWKYSILDAVRISFESSPVLSIIILIQTLISAITPTILIIATAWFINQSMQIIVKHLSLWKALLPILCIVALITYQWIISSIMKLVWTKLELKLSECFHTAIVEKRGRLKYGYIENHETWDLINRVAESPEKSISKVFRTLTGIFCLTARIVGILMLLMIQVWWAALIIIGFSIPLLYLAKKSGEETYETNRSVTKYQRSYKYISSILMGREASQERSLFAYCEHMNTRWGNEYGTVGRIVLKVTKHWYIKLELGSILTALISVISIVALLFPVIKGIITFGMFIALVNACFSLVEAMSWDMRTYVDELAKHKGYMRDLKEFVALEEEDKVTNLPKGPVEFKTLEFKNVRFKYPDTDKYILNDISFKIEEGRHYAFVGKNGEGKSTIIKLLTGFYDGYQGKIIINGKDLREYESDELKAFYSMVYQDFAKYEISLKDNIMLGNIQGCDNKKINDAVKLMSLDKVVNRLPKGINTPLGRIAPDGLDISGGQWQRVAIARSVVSCSPIHILDEPTSSLDPVAESKIYADYEQISKGRTTLFISHRLGSTKLADEIFVIDNGKLKESGNHKKLMELGGIYKEMFESQRGWYK